MVARLIEQLNPTVPGFTNPRVLGFLASLVLEYRPQNCVEIGSYMGRSAVAIASAMAMIGARGKLTCVDLFEQTVDATYLSYPVVRIAYEHAGPAGPSYKDLSRIKNIGDCFDITFERFGHLRPFIEKISANSAKFEFPDTVQFDFSFIDGDHSYNGVSRDFIALLPHVGDGHISVFDDYSQQFPDVVRFVDQLLTVPSMSKLGFEHPDIAVRIESVAQVRATLLEKLGPSGDKAVADAPGGLLPRLMKTFAAHSLPRRT